MSDEFFRTRVGLRFFEATVPALAKEADRNYLAMSSLIHPAWLRCSSVKYDEYSPSSRLASRAPQRRSRQVNSDQPPKEIGRLADGVAELNVTLGSRPHAREGVGPRARPRVLIVDDDEQILRGLVRALKQDHDVLLATSPAVALAMAEAHTLDAVVTDHDLGDDDGRTGIWLLEQVRRRLPDARRILMSGGQPAIDDHLESGLVGRFLPKPVGAKDVLAVLRMKLCVKCRAEISDAQLLGDERCARCGDAP